MDRCGIDERLREVYESNAPLVDESAFAARLRRKSSNRQMLPAPRPRVRHAWLIAASSLLVVAALVVGTYEAVVHMGRDGVTMVITDDSLSPGNGGAAALTGAKAELWAEIQRIREGVKSGALALEWPAPGVAAGNLPSDPMQLLDSLEQTVFAPDVTLYLGDSTGEASALQSEILALPEVSRLVFVSKDDALAELKEDFKDNPEVLQGLASNPLPARLEVWLKDSEQATAFADRFRERPEIDEALSPQMDYAGWTARLRNLAHSAGDSETSTTWMTAPTNEAPSGAPSVSSTTGTTGDTGPRLKWGDVARLPGREVKIEKPVEKPQETGLGPGSMVVYALVTITNTGAETMDYAASEFSLDGNSSGSTGIATLDGTIDGLPVLAPRGTLSPGGSVTAAVCFSLSKGDVPIKVRMGTQFSTATVLASWQ